MIPTSTLQRVYIPHVMIVYMLILTMCHFLLVANWLKCFNLYLLIWDTRAQHTHRVYIAYHY